MLRLRSGSIMTGDMVQEVGSMFHAEFKQTILS